MTYKLFSTDGQFIKNLDNIPPSYNKYEKITGFILFFDGNKQWYKDGILHREDGPAFECHNGSKVWYVNGKRHKLDGPAIEWHDGAKVWFIDDKRIY